MKKLSDHADVIVVGGGPVGALTALRLAQQGRQVILIEARDKSAPVQDARALALSWYSQQCLADVGAWPESLPCTAIDTVHVSQQQACGRTLLNKDDLALPHLGWVVDYPALTQVINNLLEAAGVRVMWSARVEAVKSLAQYGVVSVRNADAVCQLTCRLVVLAEGGGLVETLPGVKRQVHDYKQSAVLALLKTERPHQQVAYERFAHNGPFALLPHEDGYMMVWTRTHEDAMSLQQMSEESAIAELQQALGERQGKILSMGPRAVFPLMLKQATRVCSGRVVLVGNAAQTMHPVAAQGLNLGLRDAMTLTERLKSARDVGDAALLRAYADARKVDSYSVVGFTHGLVSLFDHPTALATALRGMGMTVLDAIPALRKTFARHLVFGV